MSVEEAILELLKVHNRVILPGFGAFLVAKDDSAEKPYVLFNGFLSFNDGLLVDYLVETNGVDSVVAADYCTEYVFNLKATLQEAKIYKFNFLGTFDFDESGGMRFRYNPNIGRMPQKPGTHAKPAPKVEPKNEVKSEKKKDAKIESTEPATLKPIVEKVDIIPHSVKPINTSSDDLLSIDNSSSPVVIIDEAPSLAGNSTIAAGKTTFELDEEKSSMPNGGKIKVVDVEEKKFDVNDSTNGTTESRGRVLVASIAVLILFFFIGGYFYFYYFPHKAEAAARQKVMELAVKIKEERIKFQSDSLAAVKVRELALADSLNKIETSSKALINGYHLIIGAFADEKNADKLLSKVITTYPRAQKIIYRNRFMVSVDAFTSKDEAQNHIGKVTQTLQVDCWIHRN